MMFTKKLKILIASGGLFAIAAIYPFVTLAQTTITPSVIPNQAGRLANLHTLADNAINMRLTDLTTAQTRINSLVKLSTDQKSQFNGEITTDINGLTSLKAKCDADVDLPTLRTDYKTIFTQYRVYAEFLPQLHLSAASDTMSVTANKLSDFATKLQGRIQNSGNPSNLTNLLSDMQAKIGDANTQYGNVESQITPLTPQSYDNDPTGTSSTLKNARSEIQTGAGDLKAAWSDATQIVQALKTPSPTH